jgi:hypothetical protein
MPGDHRPLPGRSRRASWGRVLSGFSSTAGAPSTGTPGAAPGLGRRRRNEEYRRWMSPPSTDEEAAFAAVARVKWVDAPVDDSNAPGGPGRRKDAFGRRTELRSVAGRESQVPGADQGRGNAPAAERPPYRARRVPSRPLGVADDGDHPGGAGADAPGAGKLARKATGPNRSVAVSVAVPSGRFQRPREDRGERSRRRHGAFFPSTVDRSQSLASRSCQARAVRETCSEKPVNTGCTRPSDHSRNTWGIK